MILQYISAPWCKRCTELRPEITRLCSITGTTFTYVDYDEMDDEDPLKAEVSALPTARLSVGPDEDDVWTLYAPAEFDKLKEVLTVAATATAIPMDLDV